MHWRREFTKTIETVNSDIACSDNVYANINNTANAMTEELFFLEKLFLIVEKETCKECEIIRFFHINRMNGINLPILISMR